MPDPQVRPRIAYLTGQYPAVSHTFILREILALRAMGFSIDTCSVRASGPEHQRGPDERDAAATSFYVQPSARSPRHLARTAALVLGRPRSLARMMRRAWSIRPPGLRGLAYHLFYAAEAALLAAHLDGRGIARLHNHFAGASASVSLLAAVFLDIPFSFTLHGPADLVEAGSARLDRKIAAADFVACISHFARSQAMIHADPADWPKLRIVHCAVDPARYADAGDGDLRGPQGPVRLVFVGRLAPVKGVRVLLDAVGKALARGADLHLTVIGDGPDRATLQAAAAPLGGAVRFTGYRSQDEVAAHLAESDLFVLASFAEGVPVVLMEAMASGLPVVATRIAGIPELVDDGKSGAIVAPGDAAALADAIARLAADPELRRRMGRAGRAAVSRDFALQTEAARLARLFSEGPDAALRPQPLAAAGDPRPDPAPIPTDPAPSAG
ncbi:glycosyltransferase [Paracoccus sediminis]|uniref:Glycosyltransferase involved in cell wall bisynthesis n=1 Tax=Paracoccus sediminis TaxID=1214787 RepID=A0A238Y6V2_9RHOB|nr:glycosyltransferase [Paracoccus sediminis]SNR66682.1 Glycosyltransferase involved in cell wall bisynthesis [Paracoccus sediminis]